MSRALYKAPVLLLLISLSIVGQTEASKTDSITGRVVNESGQPLPNARVSVMPVGGGRPGSLTNTDSEGAFKGTRLVHVSYRIYVEMAAYLSTSDEPGSGPSARQCKVGESAR